MRANPGWVQTLSGLDLDLGVRLMNEGPPIASNPYISFKIILPGPSCRVEFKPDSSGHWQGNQAFGVFFSSTSIADFRLAPQSPVRPVRFRFQLLPPFENRYLFEMHYGADDSAPAHLVVELSVAEIANEYAEAVRLMKELPWQDAMQEFYPVLFGGTREALT